MAFFISPSKARAEIEAEAKAPPGKITIFHFVQKGDTLSELGSKHKINPWKIKVDNNIANIDLIYIGQTLKLEMKERSSEQPIARRKQAQRNSCRNLSFEEKMNILGQVDKRTGVHQEVLAGQARQESSFGRSLVGDDGRSIGPFQINLSAHPEVTRAQAMNWEWSANWAADYLIKQGYKQNSFMALRRYNGSVKNPKTEKYAKAVMSHAKKYYGLKDINV
ncbi:LysM peptidoglycan-binding domain-containing protein [Candidatus Parcubacteria bacterium]|nr:LysM peptidoglycan-binding domain-containing protein [Patescibacteria group bacterium]MCG2696546.1 LysM peptidoglycan-binding domain-containing protein [Candidatus Parcubacteria bacterium]